MEEVADKKFGVGAVAIVLLSLNFFLVYLNLTTEIMWFVIASIGVVALVLIVQLINENRILQYFGRISLIVLCIYRLVYRIVVKIISIPLHIEIDVVRENFLLVMDIVMITMFICSVVYEFIVRFVPQMIGKKINNISQIVSSVAAVLGT